MIRKAAVRVVNYIKTNAIYSKRTIVFARVPQNLHNSNRAIYSRSIQMRSNKVIQIYKYMKYIVSASTEVKTFEFFFFIPNISGQVMGIVKFVPLVPPMAQVE